jgi:hypothetical protein
MFQLGVLIAFVLIFLIYHAYKLIKQHLVYERGYREEQLRRKAIERERINAAQSQHKDWETQ